MQDGSLYSPAEDNTAAVAADEEMIEESFESESQTEDELVQPITSFAAHSAAKAALAEQATSAETWSNQGMVQTADYEPFPEPLDHVPSCYPEPDAESSPTAAATAPSAAAAASAAAPLPDVTAVADQDSIYMLYT